jgi:hypothetical protein
MNVRFEELREDVLRLNLKAKPMSKSRENRLFTVDVFRGL